MKRQPDRARQKSLALPTSAPGKIASEHEDSPPLAERKSFQDDTSWAKADWFRQWERVARREV